MRILFAHKNFPRSSAPSASGWPGRGGRSPFSPSARGGLRRLPGRRLSAEHRPPAEGIHRYVRPLEGAAITGQAFARAAVDLDRSGFTPDIVMSHAGWGVGTFLKDVWPATCAIPYFEWYYNWPYPGPHPLRRRGRRPARLRARNRLRNAALWADFSTASRALCPTRFQAAQFPAWMRDRLTVMHDGVDTDLHSPGEGPGRAGTGRSSPAGGYRWTPRC